MIVSPCAWALITRLIHDLGCEQGTWIMTPMGPWEPVMIVDHGGT